MAFLTFGVGVVTCVTDEGGVVLPVGGTVVCGQFLVKADVGGNGSVYTAVVVEVGVSVTLVAVMAVGTPMTGGA